MILVTGSEGFIGMHLMKTLGFRAKGYDLKSGQDILDREKLGQALKGCESIIHLAALTSVPLSIERPFDYYRTNVIGTVTLLAEAEKAGIKKIVYAGSSSAYQPESSPYARSKYLAEEVIKTFSGKVVIPRFFNVFGPGQNPDYAGVIPKFLECFRNERVPVIYGDGFQTRDFTHVLDVVKGVIACHDIDVETKEPVDLGYGTPITINDLFKTMAEMFGAPAVVRYTPQREEVRHSRADPTVANLHFDWMPEMLFQDRLEMFIDESN